MAKATMKRCIFILCILFFAFGLCAAQTTYNLENIYQRGIPDTSLRYWGNRLAGVGDVNGDGFDDVAISAYTRNTWKPKIYLYFGSAAGLDTIYDLLIEPPVESTMGSIAGGDINKDGYSDIILGLEGSTKKIWVYYGGPTVDTIPDITFSNSGKILECQVATGDLNGDDTTDIIVGDYWGDDNNGLDGHVYIFKGSAQFDTLPWLEIKGRNDEELGSTVGSGGDVNNDGYQDLYAGAPGNNAAYTWAGRLYIFYGGVAMDTIPDFIKNGEGASQFWGEYSSALCPAENEYGRFWTGNNCYPGGYMTTKQNGKAELFYGGIVMDTVPDMTITGADSFTNLGVTFASALIDSGFNGDLICGAAEPTGIGMGRCWTSKLAQDTIVDGWLQGRWVGDQIGVNTANAGDVNGDGREEIMFGSYTDTNRLVVVCKYTGPDGIEGKTDSLGQNIVLKLSQNFPNPFKQSTAIDYQISEKRLVNLSVYNIAGQKVKTLINEIINPGFYRVKWDGRDDKGQKVAGGVYFYRFTSDKKYTVKKMVVLH